MGVQVVVRVEGGVVDLFMGCTDRKPYMRISRAHLGLGIRVEGLGLRVEGLGFRGLGLRVEG